MELASDSISVKVSEAIMHMQENSVTISTKVRKAKKDKAQTYDREIKLKLKLRLSFFLVFL